MSAVFPFRALRPTSDSAPRIASVPYDVVSTEEARALVAGNPSSFLRVTRSEVDLPPETNPYDAQVYGRAARNLEDLRKQAPLVLEAEPSLYLYRLRMGLHEQIGVAGCFSLDEYDRDLVKKHERTRKDKEDDRTRHITELRAQTGLVFLTYRASATIDDLVKKYAAAAPLYDFVAPDGIAHTVWAISPMESRRLVDAFASLPALYIADGHHRAASAARARDAAHGEADSVESARFIGVAFPDTQVQILPYNRLVRDLAGATPDAFLAEVRRYVTVEDGSPTPARSGEVSMFLAGRWYRLILPKPAPGTSPADALDVAVLDRILLGPVLQIGDVRTDKRIDFVGGARGTAELERRVSAGDAAVAFSLYPVSVEDLMAIADAGGIMPPKSTWFEPKLRDGLLVHLI
jgi:uncharacterized protein (DUF1015 family)